MRRVQAIMAAIVIGIAFGRANSADVIRATDGTTILVNKDVDGNRWAITYNGVRQRVTGNVTVGSGGVVFLECGVAGDDGESLELACDSLPLTGHPERVVLPASFFGLTSGACPDLDSVGRSYAWAITMTDECGHLFTAKAEFTQVACEASGYTEDASDPRFAGALISMRILPSGRLATRVDFNGLCAGAAAGDLVLERANESWGFYQFSGEVTGPNGCCPIGRGQLLLSLGFE